MRNEDVGKFGRTMLIVGILLVYLKCKVLLGINLLLDYLSGIIFLDNL